MSENLNPRVVLKFLNQLGYYKITSQQLKEFIQDLKILIRHEEKMKNNSANCDENNDIGLKSKSQNNDIGLKLKSRNNGNSSSQSTSTINSKSTVCSRIKTAEKEVLDKNGSLCSGDSKARPSRVNSSDSLGENINNLKLNQVPSLSVKSLSNVNSKVLTEILPSVKSKTSHCPTKKLHELKSNVSFIRTKMPPKVCKSDPVTLYEKYQEIWKKQKIPGVDHHKSLRWAVRERLLGDVVAY